MAWDVATHLLGLVLSPRPLPQVPLRPPACRAQKVPGTCPLPSPCGLLARGEVEALMTYVRISDLPCVRGPDLTETPPAGSARLQTEPSSPGLRPRLPGAFRRRVLRMRKVWLENVAMANRTNLSPSGDSTGPCDSGVATWKGLGCPPHASP